MKVKDFRVGQIYKMSPTTISHVKKPYYVEVIEVGSDFIITNIPGGNSTKISILNGNWQYQTDRMSFIGDKESFGHLLTNQKLTHS